MALDILDARSGRPALRYVVTEDLPSVNVEIKIQAPLPHQKVELDRTERFKVWRWGRRASKTRGAFIGAVLGHGAQPHGVGLLAGGEILWIARDYPNSDTIWRKEILRRFANKLGFNVNKQDRRVECEANGGSLTICSADNIDSVRGGDWDGVVISEAAHQDLANVWAEVVRPGLADRKGWAIIESTTKGGSYFNQLCERCIAGEMGPAWHQSHYTAFDNPKIDKQEIQDMIAEYADEVQLKQEIFAELVVPGGFAFPEWDSDVHVQKAEPPNEWTWVGSMDYNYVAPSWFGLAAMDKDRIMWRWGYRFQKIEPFDLGFRIGMALRARFPKPAYVLADAQMFANTAGQVTIAGEVQAGLAKAYGGEAPGLIAAPKGPNSRIQSKILVHKLLKFERNADGTISPWKAPRMTFHPDCAEAIMTLPKLVRDEHNPEDVKKDSARDGCLAPGTMLLTVAGWRPIADIPEARITKRNAQTVRLTFSNGVELVCTPDHRIMTTDGWKRAENLRDMEEILWWSPKPSKSLMASATTCAATTLAGLRTSSDLAWSETRFSIGTYGEQVSGRSLTSITFTTSMAIPPITDSPISRASRHPSTRLIIPVCRPQDSERLAQETPSDLVERAISQCLASSEPVRLLRLTRHGKLPMLYDVDVAHPFHGFVSQSGLVVHNSYDAIRGLAMMHAPNNWREKPNEEPRPDRHPGFSEGVRRKWNPDEEEVQTSRYMRTASW